MRKICYQSYMYKKNICYFKIDLNGRDKNAIALIFLSIFSWFEFVVKYTVAWIWYSLVQTMEQQLFSALLPGKTLLGDTFSLLCFKNQKDK